MSKLDEDIREALHPEIIKAGLAAAKSSVIFSLAADIAKHVAEGVYLPADAAVKLRRLSAAVDFAADVLDPRPAENNAPNDEYPEEPQPGKAS